MIKINDKKYDKYNTSVSWGKFSVSSSLVKREGKAPFIEFIIEDNFLIGLELTFSKEMFEETPVNKKVDISRYLSDITFEDNKGWISIIENKYECYITRIDKNDFEFDFHIVCDDFDDIANIDILSKVSILVNC